MRPMIQRSLALALLASGLAGCGGGGIEPGTPSNAPYVDPQKGPGMENMQKEMNKGPNAVTKPNPPGPA